MSPGGVLSSCAPLCQQHGLDYVCFLLQGRQQHTFLLANIEWEKDARHEAAGGDTFFLFKLRVAVVKVGTRKSQK